MQVDQSVIGSMAERIERAIGADRLVPGDPSGGPYKNAQIARWNLGPLLESVGSDWSADKPADAIADNLGRMIEDMIPSGKRMVTCPTLRACAKVDPESFQPMVLFFTCYRLEDR